MKLHSLVRTSIGIAMIMGLGAGAQAAEVKVLASNGVKTVLEELGPQFEKATGHKLAFRFAPAAAARADIAKSGAGMAMRKGAPKPDIAAAVANGEAEFGFTQVSEILHVAGAELAGPLPPGVQIYTVFPGAVASGSSKAAAAQAVIKFLTAPAAAPVIKSKGMEPG